MTTAGPEKKKLGPSPTEAAAAAAAPAAAAETLVFVEEDVVSSANNKAHKGQEDLAKALSALEILACGVFDTVETRIRETSAKCEEIAQRVHSAAQRVEAIAQSRATQATTVYAAPKYPHEESGVRLRLEQKESNNSRNEGPPMAKSYLLGASAPISQRRTRAALLEGLGGTQDIDDSYSPSLRASALAYEDTLRAQEVELFGRRRRTSTAVGSASDESASFGIARVREEDSAGISPPPPSFLFEDEGGKHYTGDEQQDQYDVSFRPMLRGPTLLDMPTSLDLPDIADLSITDFGALGRRSGQSEDVSRESASAPSLNADTAPLPKPKASVGPILGVTKEGVSAAGVDLAPIVANLETAAPARNENQDANATNKSFIDAAKNQASYDTKESAGTQPLGTSATSPRPSAEKAATLTTNSKESKTSSSTSSSGLGGALLAAIRAPENRAKLRRADFSAASDDANRHRARDAKAAASTLPQPQSQLTLAEEMRLNLARRQKVLSGKLDEEQQAADAARRASLQGSVLAVAAAGKFLRSVPEEDGGGGRGVASTLSPRARASRRRHLESARSPGVQGLALSMDNMGSIDAFLDLKNQPGDELGASDADQSSASGWDTD